MPQPKVFIFSPADPTGETYRQMAADGCEVVLGDASWHTPMGNNEDDMCEMAKGADALSGTSIRSSPITARIMDSAPELRIIAKTTIGLDVFQDEPLPADSLLRKLGHKVLLSPHMVTSNLNSGLKPGIEWATRSMFSALRGEVPDNVFNKEVIPKWLERFGGRKVL